MQPIRQGTPLIVSPVEDGVGSQEVSHDFSADENPLLLVRRGSFTAPDRLEVGARQVDHMLLGEKAT
jgi:hypothetical protein